MGNYWRRREEINRMYKARRFKYWKYTCIVLISILLAILIAMIVWMDELSLRAMLFMRGCAGVVAILFVIFYAIWTYKVYRDYQDGGLDEENE